MSVTEVKHKEELDKARNQIPAGEFSDGKKVDPEEQRKWEEQIRKANEEARVAKEQIISASLNRKPITPEYAKLLRAIHSSTFLNGNISDQRKVIAALSLQEGLSEGAIGKKKVAYLGSGLDWHFAVALGARDIDMVDTEYSKPEVVAELMKNVKAFDSEAKVQQGEKSTITFRLSLGAEPEAVTLNLFAQDVTAYEPSGDLGGVIEAQGPTKGYTDGSSPVLPNVAKHLPTGAFVLNFAFYQEQRTPVAGLEAFGNELFNLHTVSDPAKLQTLSTHAFRKPS